MNEPLESLRPPPAPQPALIRPRSPRLAWAITLGESALLAGAAFPLIKYWLMLPAPVRLGAATVLVALALVVTFRIVRFHLRRVRRRNNSRRTIARPLEIEPEPVSAQIASSISIDSSNGSIEEPGTGGLPCKKRLRNSTVLMPSGSSTCP